jgi:hypothetical protein
MAKLRQKISGCLRTLTGARQFCAIRSYLSSAAKHGTGFFDALVMLTKGEPWMPASTRPNHNDLSHLTSYMKLSYVLSDYNPQNKAIFGKGYQCKVCLNIRSERLGGSF